MGIPTPAAEPSHARLADNVRGHLGRRRAGICRRRLLFPEDHEDTFVEDTVLDLSLSREVACVSGSLQNWRRTN